MKHVLKTGGSSIEDIAYDRIFISAEKQEVPIGTNLTRTRPVEIMTLSTGPNMILLKGLQPGAHISIFNSDGRLLDQYQASSEELMIPTASYPPGLYIVRAIHGSTYASVKFVK